MGIDYEQMVSYRRRYDAGMDVIQRGGFNRGPL
jgi:hypothetical protein